MRLDAIPIYVAAKTMTIAGVIGYVDTRAIPAPQEQTRASLPQSAPLPDSNFSLPSEQRAIMLGALSNKAALLLQFV